MRRFPARAIALALLLPLLTAVPSAQAATSSAALTRWSSTEELSAGTWSSNATVASGKVQLSSGTVGYWASPWQAVDMKGTSLVPSWSATTPSGSHLRVWARVKSGSTTGSWDSIGYWALGTDAVKRSSSSSQTDDLVRLATDTLVANSGKSFDAWQIKVELKRTKSSGATPTLYAAGAVAAPFTTRTRSTSATTMTSTVDLAVPAYSQMTHKSHFKQYDGGGAAWCSPTSVSMALKFAGLGPKSSAYAYTKESQGFVDYAAARSYDHRYEGTGNWAFSTAYATEHGSDAFVTRLDSLAEAERFIKAGIPVVVSIAFSKGGLSGSPLTSTPGHLLVIRGFQSDGRVIVNDPAAPSASSVRRVYNRAQLEAAWMKGSGGLTYVVRKSSTQALPGTSAHWS